ncbi:hypothetical protein QZH41_015326, partial [Actinostola sp. cb2023]
CTISTINTIISSNAIIIIITCTIFTINTIISSNVIIIIIVISCTIFTINTIISSNVIIIITCTISIINTIISSNVIIIIIVITCTIFAINTIISTDDEEKAEEFKILSFIAMVKDCSKIGIPYGHDSAQKPFDPFVVEKWPLIQAYALEGFGGGGFFTMVHEVVDTTSSLNEVFGMVDPVVAEMLITERLPLFERHCTSVLANVDVESGTSGSLSKITESLVGEPLVSYYKHGHISNSHTNPSGDTDRPFVMFGINTRKESLDKAKRNASNNKSTTLSTCGIAGSPAKHMVCYARDPKGTISCIRTYFFGNGFLPCSGSDDDDHYDMMMSDDDDDDHYDMMMSDDDDHYDMMMMSDDDDHYDMMMMSDDDYHYDMMMMQSDDDDHYDMMMSDDDDHYDMIMSDDDDHYDMMMMMSDDDHYDMMMSDDDDHYDMMMSDDDYHYDMMMMSDDDYHYDMMMMQSDDDDHYDMMKMNESENSNKTLHQSKDLILLIDLYLLAIDAILDGIKSFVQTQDIKQAKGAVDACLKLGLSKKSLSLDSKNIKFSFEGQDFLGRKVDCESKPHVPCIKTASLYLYDIPSIEHPGSLLGSVAFGETFLDSAVTMLDQDNKGPWNSQYVIITENVLRFTSWQGGNEERELSSQLEDFAKSNKEGNSLGKQLAHGDICILAGQSLYSKYEEGTLYIYEKGFLFIHPRFRAVFLPLSAFTKMQFYDGLLLTILTGVPGSGKDQLCNTLVALAKENSKWIVLKSQLTHTQPFDAKVLQASLSNTVSSQKKLLVRMSAGRKRMRVILVTQGFTDIVEIVQAIYSHPKAEVKNHIKIGAITCCVDPENMFMEERYTLPKLLDQCSQGWVNTVVFTSCLDPQNERLAMVQKFFRACNPDVAFILAKGGEVTRSSDVDLILSDNAFTKDSAVQKRHLMCPGWSLGVFNPGPCEPPVSEICINMYGPLDKSLLVTKLRALQGPLNLKDCITSSVIYSVRGHIHFVDHNTITEVHWTALKGSLTMKTVDVSAIPRPPPKATQNGSVDQNFSSYFMVFTGFSLQEGFLKELLRSCCRPKPQKKALKGLKDLTKKELEQI